MKKVKRKAREDSGADVTIPIGELMIIGSKDDPCFGKYQDPLNSICKQCGDAEMCAIVMGQRLHAKRNEQGHDFKDEEEPNLDIERLEKYITRTLSKTDKLSLTRLQAKVIKYFSTFEKVDEAKAKKMVLDFVKRSPKYKRLMINGIKYLKLK